MSHIANLSLIIAKRELPLNKGSLKLDFILNELSFWIFQIEQLKRMLRILVQCKCQPNLSQVYVEQGEG